MDSKGYIEGGGTKRGLQLGWSFQDKFHLNME